MPIPGSVLVEPVPFDPSTLPVYESLATLRIPTTTTSASGQKVNSFMDTTTPAHIDMPCRKAPLVLERPRDQEVPRTGVQDFDAKFHINVAKYIDIAPEVLATYQIKIDGVIYRIVAVEPDGSSITTRLMVSKPVPFAE